LSLFGALGSLGMWLARGPLATQFGNPSLTDCALPMALICLTLVITAPLEIQLTAEGRVRDAAFAIFFSDAVRVGASVVPLFLGLGLMGLLWANVAHGALRVLACLWLLKARGGPRIDRARLREQLGYSLPFGAAILLAIPQQTFHQWAVGARVTPSEFAVYMVGCFQVPIINLLYSPISDVLQVRLAAPSGREHAVSLFHEANLRLAAVFFPLTAGLCAAGALFIPALFTHRYDDSVPIFRLALLTIPFAALPLDGTLRALGRTRYIFHNSAWKLALTAVAVLGGLHFYGMVGAIAGHCAVEALLRTAMLLRVRRELNTSLAHLLPWGHLTHLAVAALIACVPVVAIAQLHSARAKPFQWLLVSGLAYGAVYLVALALGPGQGTPVVRLKRALLGNAEPVELKRAA
jgi:O-antigen/teichoic acid export membrane protein